MARKASTPGKPGSNDPKPEKAAAPKARPAASKKKQGGSAITGLASALAIIAAVVFGLCSKYPLRDQALEWSSAAIPEPAREWSIKILSMLPSPPPTSSPLADSSPIAEAAPVDPSPPAPASKTVMVFMNGEHTGGVEVVLDSEYDLVESIEKLLSVKLGCKRVVDMPDVDSKEPCKVRREL